MGDAAHALPPEMLMGANLALEDGFEMANCLMHDAAIVAGQDGANRPHVKTALDLFEARRKKRIEWWAADSLRLQNHGANFTVPSGFRARVRDAMLGWRFSSSGLKTQLRRNGAWDIGSLIDGSAARRRSDAPY
jgi:2-polyprenyl-6-methoxyphenol hydroxylase-like FAD-dependent oxidoreductase